ncbi:MAG: phosphoserine phosphatase RsbU/P [Streptosporangiaceae bacterium]|nr:phosphoserine phosphatase RsbU/P [Streptosporangiaceae bacterium]
MPEDYGRGRSAEVERRVPGRPAAGVARPAVLPGWAEKLRDIQSITDAALSALDPQMMLQILAGRVKDALQADTAAVLLLDRRSGQLVAAAASGLEEEVRQGVRVPLGRGFAGRIAAEGRPVIIDEVDRTKVVNPVLLDKGIRSLMGAPLLADGAVIGVLHVGTLRPRIFTGEDTDLLQLAADRAAIAVQALTNRVERAAAAALQHSLLPSALPAVIGLDMAARYVPGGGHVGGDWYDVFPLPSGEVCAVIGDVTGTGLSAAVIMGRMRSALRAYALQASGPAEILDCLGQKMRHFEPEAMATVLCAVFSPSLDEARISSAGHLPPLLAAPGQAAAPVAVFPDLPIGVPGPAPRRVSTVPFPPGAVLCLYTDGLVERRDRPLDDGIARLSAALTASATDPESSCASVMAAMTDYSPHDDDIALLMLRHGPGIPGHGGQEQPGSAAPLTGQDQGVRWSGRHAVVTMPGEIDVTNAPGLAALLTTVAGQSPEAITADLTTTVFCDSAGVEVLARACQLAAIRGAEFRLALGDSPVARILELTGLDALMPLYRDVEHSLAALPGPAGQQT